MKIIKDGSGDQTIEILEFKKSENKLKQEISTLSSKLDDLKQRYARSENLLHHLEPMMGYQSSHNVMFTASRQSFWVISFTFVYTLFKLNQFRKKL